MSDEVDVSTGDRVELSGYGRYAEVWIDGRVEVVEEETDSRERSSVLINSTDVEAIEELFE